MSTFSNEKCPGLWEAAQRLLAFAGRPAPRGARSYKGIQAGLFQRHVVVVAEVVDAGDGVAPRQQRPAHGGADKAGRAGYENVHGGIVARSCAILLVA
jgi:hypothetical protein